MLEVKVNVQIGVTPEVASLVSAILNKPAGVEAPKPAAPAAETEAPAEAAAAPAARRGRPKKEQAAQAEAPAEQPAEAAAPAAVQKGCRVSSAPAADPKPEDAGEDMPDSVYFPQEEDVRTAMHKTRERIEGEDYKDKPSDDLHRAVTDVFKAIANDLSGQKKPSALPQELRQAFIDATRTIQQDVDGKFTYEVKK